MVLLSRINNVISVTLALALSACAPGDTVTETVEVPLNSDTYIASNSDRSYGELEMLHVSNTGGVEERVLIPLPSEDGSNSEESFVSAIFIAIFGGLFSDGCDRSKIIDPEYLTEATLRLDMIDASMSSQASQLSLRVLSRGWWQSATWTRAHPFTSEGRWNTPGGDIDDSIGAVVGTLVSGSSTDVEFDIKALVTRANVFSPIEALNGFRIDGAPGTDVSFHSSQSSWGEYSRPRLVFTYEGPCVPTNSTTNL